MSRAQGAVTMWHEAGSITWQLQRLPSGPECAPEGQTSVPNAAACPTG